jgi:pimeloyl-ACP methyl ester carboxylesterase
MDRIISNIVHQAQTMIAEQVIGASESNIDGIQYYDTIGYGDLGTIIIIPGICSCAADWCEVVAKLRPRYTRIVVMDLPGFGTSDPIAADCPDLGAEYMRKITSFISRVVHESYILVGHSYGGGIVAKFSATSKQNPYLKGIFLIAPAGEVMDHTRLDYLSSLFTGGKMETSKKLTQKVFRNTNLMSLNIIGYLMNSRIATNDATIKIFEYTKSDKNQFFTSEMAAMIKCPTYIVWGDDDQITPVSGAEIFKKITNSSCTIIPDCGHCVHVETIEVANHILGFGESLKHTTADQIRDKIRGILLG